MNIKDTALIKAVKAKTDLIPDTFQNIIGSVRLVAVNGSYANAATAYGTVTITPPVGETWLVYAALRYFGSNTGRASVAIYANSGGGVVMELDPATVWQLGVSCVLVVTNADPLVFRTYGAPAGTSYYQYHGVKI